MTSLDDSDAADDLILDCDFGPIRAARELSRILSERAGIVAHGPSLGLATEVVIAGAHGIRHRTRGEEPSS